MFPCCDLGGFPFPLLLDSLMLSFVLAACPYRHDLLWSSQTCTALPRALHLFRIFIGWEAAGTLRPMSRPISTSERCCILSAM